MLQGRRLEDAHLVFVGGRYLARVRATVQSRDPDIVMHSARNNLHPFEGAGQDHDVTAGRICLSIHRDRKREEDAE